MAMGSDPSRSDPRIHHSPLQTTSVACKKAERGKVCIECSILVEELNHVLEATGPYPTRLVIFSTPLSFYRPQRIKKGFVGTHLPSGLALTSNTLAGGDMASSGY